MIKKGGVMHCIGWCLECGAEWQNHRTAQSNALRHARDKSHKVGIEIAYSYTYTPENQ